MWTSEVGRGVTLQPFKELHAARRIPEGSKGRPQAKRACGWPVSGRVHCQNEFRATRGHSLLAWNWLREGNRHIPIGRRRYNLSPRGPVWWTQGTICPCSTNSDPCIPKTHHADQREQSWFKEQRHFGTPQRMTKKTMRSLANTIQPFVERMRKQEDEFSYLWKKIEQEGPLDNRSFT